MISARHAVCKDCERIRASSILRSVRQDSPSGDGVSQRIELVTRSVNVRSRALRLVPGGFFSV
jgi:hypothetical protein